MEKQRSLFSAILNRAVLESLDPLCRYPVWDYSRDFSSPYLASPQIYGADKPQGLTSAPCSGSKASDFEFLMSVIQFQPSELDVKVKDNTVIIHGKHDEKPDGHGFVSREFYRRYVLPDDIDPETVQPVLSPDGLLYVKAVKKGGSAKSEPGLKGVLKVALPPDIKAAAKAKSQVINVRHETPTKGKA